MEVQEFNGFSQNQIVALLNWFPGRHDQHTADEPKESFNLFLSQPTPRRGFPAWRAARGRWKGHLGFIRDPQMLRSARMHLSAEELAQACHDGMLACNEEHGGQLMLLDPSFLGDRPVFAAAGWPYSTSSSHDIEHRADKFFKAQGGLGVIGWQAADEVLAAANLTHHEIGTGLSREEYFRKQWTDKGDNDPSGEHVKNGTRPWVNIRSKNPFYGSNLEREYFKVSPPCRTETWEVYISGPKAGKPPVLTAVNGVPVAVPSVPAPAEDDFLARIDAKLDQIIAKLP